MIAGPIEYIIKSDKLSEELRPQLQVVERNTDRMLRLVNQILDFRKIQKNKMKLRIEKIDVVPFVRRIMDNFEGLAEDHHIDLKVKLLHCLCGWMPISWRRLYSIYSRMRSNIRLRER